MIKCDYGCGQKAMHQFKNGKWCCSLNWIQCPIEVEKHRKRNTGILNPMFGKPGWSRGIKRSKLKEETKEKMRGRIPWNKGKENVYSKDTLEKMSKVHKGILVGEKNPFFGKKHSQETLKKMTQSRNGKDGRSKESIEKQRQWMLNGGSIYANSFPRDPKKNSKS